MRSRGCTVEFKVWWKLKAEKLGRASAGAPGHLCGPRIVTSLTGGMGAPPTPHSDGSAGLARSGELPSLPASDALPSHLPLISSSSPHSPSTSSPSPPYGLHIWLMTIQRGCKCLRPFLSSLYLFPPPPAESPYDSTFCVPPCLPQVPCKNRTRMQALRRVIPSLRIPQPTHNLIKSLLPSFLHLEVPLIHRG